MAARSRKNAFSFFLDEYITSERAAGRKLSYKLGAEECAPKWQALSEDEKAKYLKMVGNYRSRGTRNDKLNTFGISCADLELEQELLRKKIEDADEEIKSTLISLNADTLPQHLFYLVHCNYYCKTDEGLYIPGEIAICEFNLKSGIKRKYHTLINPGKIPLGFAYEARHNIDDCHGLPYPPYPEGNCDYYAILKEILEFLEPGKLPDGRYPPLYGLEKNIKAVESIFESLNETDIVDENRISVNPFRMFLLHKMFFWLKNRCADLSGKEPNVAFPVLSNAILEIEKDVFCYVSGLSCNFHCNLDDKYQNCSLSVVQRFVYVICDHCCHYLRIELIPGFHGRLNCDTKRDETVAVLKSRLDSVLCNESKNGKVKTQKNVNDICSFYGGKSVPTWTKVTPGNFLDDEIQREFTEVKHPKPENPWQRNMKSVLPASGRGKGEETSSAPYDDEFPALSMGRGLSRRRK